MSTAYRITKRVFDVVAASAVLVLSSPLWLVASLAIKVSDRGTVLYVGQRIGRGGVPFGMYKFRTMVVDAESRGGPSTAADDPRLTRVGARLRAWKLDELPQMINVLRGDMSLVGPRPQVAVDVARYTADELDLLAVRPGITDWASIRFRDEGEILRGHADPDEAYDRLIRPEKMRLGLLYARHPSTRVDLVILYYTCRALLGSVPATTLWIAGEPVDLCGSQRERE